MPYLFSAPLLFIVPGYCPSCLFFCPGQGGHGAQREVTLTLKHGVEAKNYDDVSTGFCTGYNTGYVTANTL